MCDRTTACEPSKNCVILPAEDAYDSGDFTDGMLFDKESCTVYFDMLENLLADGHVQSATRCPVTASRAGRLLHRIPVDFSVWATVNIDQ